MKNIFYFALLSVLWTSPAAAELTVDTPTDVVIEPRSFTYVNHDHLKRLTDLHKRAEELITTDRLEEAAKVYDEIIFEEPDDETAYTQLGHISLVLGRFTKAEIAYRNALAINPENEEAWQGLDKIKDPDQLRIVPFSEEEILKQEGIVEEQSPQAHEAAVPSATKTKTPWKIKVQTALQNAGLYTGPLNGEMNADTRHAIMKFQEQHNLKTDGIVGPKTWSKLEPYLNQ